MRTAGRSLLGAIGLLLAGATFGCATIIDADFDKPFEDAGSGSGGSTADAGNDSDAGDAGPTCAAVTVTGTVTGDTQLTKGAGAGISYGNAKLINVNQGVGSGAMRFQLPQDTFDVLSTQPSRIAALTLTVATTDNCFNYLCPPIPGTLFLHPMRNDWVEGTGGTVDKPGGGKTPDGANWFFRGPVELPWDVEGAIGPKDRGTPSSVVLNEIAPIQDLPIDPMTLQGWLDTATRSFSLQLVADDKLRIVFATMDNDTASKPKLTVKVCP
jgi:hypothetical protein